MRFSPRWALLAVPVLIGSLAVVAMPPAGADAAFTVDSNGDQGDGNPGDGICSVAADGSGPCTLRAAVEEANALLTPTVVTVPAMTITLGSQLFVGEGLDLTIIGVSPAATVIRGDGSDQLFYVDGAAALDASYLTLTGGENSGPGAMQVYGEVVVDHVEVVDNHATRGQGGAFEIAAISTPGGTRYGDLTILNSTIANNTATSDGGAIYAAYAGTSLTIVNSTFTGNTSGGYGGAIYLSDDTNVGTIDFATIIGNTAVDGGDALYVESDGVVTVTGSILGGTTDTCATAFGGTIESGGGNVVAGPTCGFAGTNDRSVATMVIGALADNGGPTRTMAIPADSPAVDNALASGCPPADQRGVVRPSGAACDSGAYEYTVAPPPTTAPTSTTSTTTAAAGPVVTPRFTG